MQHRVLLLAPWLPYPLRSGGKHRVYNVVRELANHPRVDLSVAAPATDQDEDGVAEITKLGVEVMTVPGRLGRRSVPAYMGDLLSRHPSTMVERNRSYHSLVKEKLLSCNFDILQVEFLALSRLAQGIRSPIPRCLTAHYPARVTYRRNLALLSGREPAGLLTAIDAAKLVRYEATQHRLFDRIFVVSEADRDLMPALGARGDRQYVVAPNGVDTDFFSRSRSGKRGRKKTVLSTCNFETPANVDGVEFFLRDIWPEVRKRLPDAEYVIVGRGLPESLSQLASSTSGVTPVGEVEDVRPYFEDADVSVVIMRAGGGTKIRFLTSMAMGVPVVSTRLGAEGLDLGGLDDIRVSDDTRELVDGVCHFLQRPFRPSSSLRQRAEASYSWKRTAATMVRAYDELLDRGAQQVAT